MRLALKIIESNKSTPHEFSIAKNLKYSNKILDLEISK